MLLDFPQWVFLPPQVHILVPLVERIGVGDGIVNV
jgi:hypothetical protein